MQRDACGRCDVQGIHTGSHRDSHLPIDGRKGCRIEAFGLGAEDEGDPLARHGLDPQRGEIDRPSLRRKSQRRKARCPKSLDRFGPAVQVGERRQQRPSHRNPHRLPVEGIGAIAREQHGIGAKCHRVAEDVPDVFGIRDLFQPDQQPGGESRISSNERSGPRRASAMQPR